MKKIAISCAGMLAGVLALVTPAASGKERAIPASAPVAPPVAPPVALPAGGRVAAPDARMESMRKSITGMPVRVTVPGPVLSITSVDGVLAMTFLRESALLPSMTRFAVEGDDALYTGMLSDRGRAQGRLTQITRYDFKAASPRPWQITLSQDPTMFRLQAYYPQGEDAVTLVIVTQTAAQISVVTREGNARQSRSYTAPTPAQFYTQHPELADLTLAPLFGTLGEDNPWRPGPADVYRLFDDIQPTDAQARELAKILPRLDADDPEVRESASVQLAAMGRGGVLAAMRADRKGWSAEQTTRVDSFVRRHSHVDAEALQNPDLRTLANCTADADVRVRQAAGRRISEKTGKPLPAAIPGDRASLADREAALRAIRVAVVPPATRPAEEGPAAPAAPVVPIRPL